MFSPKKAKIRFRHVYPSADIKQETEFRQIVIEWLNEIKDRQQSNLDKILPIYFQRLYGLPFIKLTTRFAILVLRVHIEHIIPTTTTSSSSSSSSSSLLSSTNNIKLLLKGQSFQNLSSTEIEHRCEELKEQIETFKSQLSTAESIVFPALEQYSKQIFIVKVKLNKLEHYNSLEFLQKINKKLINDLDRVNHYLFTIMDTIQSLSKIPSLIMPSSSLSRPPDNISGSLSSSIVEVTGCCHSKLLLNQLKQFESSVKIIKGFEFFFLNIQLNFLFFLSHQNILTLI